MGQKSEINNAQKREGLQLFSMVEELIWLETLVSLYVLSTL